MPAPDRPAGVVCVGGAVLDRHLHLLAPAVPGTSNPARAASSPGGVARNVAENLALLGVPVRLVSRVGDDDAGRSLTAHLAWRGVDVGGVAVTPGSSTAQYVAVLDPDGELVLGVAAMDVLDTVTADDVAFAPGEWLLADCNPPAPVLAAVLERASAAGVPTAVDAVSTPKVVRLAGCARSVGVLFCNADEARALAAALGAPAGKDPDDLAAALVAAGPRRVVLTRGAHGVLVADAAGVAHVPAAAADVVDVTGAGDALVAATLSRLVSGADLVAAVRFGVRAAALTVASAESVRPDLAAALLLSP